MGDAADPAYLRAKAAKCRTLANGINDSFTVAALRKMAEDYELKAAALENPLVDGVPHPSIKPPSAE